MRRTLILVFVLGLVVAACATSSADVMDDEASDLAVTTEASPTTETSTPPPPPEQSTTTSPAPATSSTTSPPTTTTTTTPPPETILYDHWKGSFQYGNGVRIDVHAPDDRSNHPIAVTVHGGGWYAGRLDSMGYLADGLAARGFVVFNATYTPVARGGSFPSMVEEVACAVAFAREHSLDYSTTADHFTLIGHSAGAHLSSLVALSPATFGGACDGGDVAVDAWVGLAGSYDTDAYAFLLQPFYGTAFAEDPTPWRAGNPYTYLDALDPAVDLLFIHGDADEIVPASMSENLFLAADLAGAPATLRILSDAGHGEVNSPRLVGDMIAEFVAADQ